MKRHDPDPAPSNWVVRDPHSYLWDTIEDDESEIDTHFPPIPTYDTTRTTTYTLGRHTITTTTRVISTRKPEEAQS
jgi:hypothetical protein